MKTAKFKDSPLGPIPQDWEVKTIAEFGQVVTGSTPPRGDKDNWNGDFPWISAQDFGGKYIRESVENISEKGKKFCRLLPADSVLVTCIASIGLNAIVKIECATNQQINAVICEKGSPDFLYYTMEFNKARFLTLAGQTAVPIINKGQFETFTVPYPPLEEQQRIAEALGEVDKLIESLDEQIEKKRLIAKGVAHDLLSAKKRLPGFKGEWKNVRLGDIGEIIRGVSYSPNNAHSSFVDGTIKLLRANNVQEGRIIFNDLVYVDSQCVSQEQRMLRGDILICAANGSKELVGKAASIDYDFETTFGAFMMVLRPNSEITGRFLKHYFVSHQYRNQLDDVLTGSAINNLNGKAVCKFTVALPLSLAEQQAIADLLSEQDAAIAALEAKREKYARIKEGMMRDLLTGKVRI